MQNPMAGLTGWPLGGAGDNYMADATQNTKIQLAQGGDSMTVTDGGSVTFESGSTLTIAAGATMSIGDGIQAPGDIALASGKLIVGNAGGVGAAVDMSGDATLANTGAVTVTVVNGVTPGTAAAGKALIADSNIDIGTLRNVTATGTVQAANLKATTSLSFENGASDIAITVNGANVVFTNVPVADPHVVGALWANSNVLTLSAG